MNEDLVKDEKLSKEYDDIFDGDEKISNLLNLSSDQFTREIKRIKVSQVGLTDPIKKSRQSTITGLTTIIKDLGVLDPIDVMTVENPDDDYKYVLISGSRRLFGAIRNGIEDIDAVVWDFKDKDLGNDLLLYLSLMLNKRQKRSYSELWHLYQILELQSSITPGTLEYLLEMEPGDAMKLKDVMMCDYTEVKEALLNEEKTLDGAYKMLVKLRKEENRLAMEDSTGVSEEAGGITTNRASNEVSEQDALELLEMTEETEKELNDDDFGELNKSAFEDVKQKVGDRKPIDPVIKQATLQRDKFMCQCCGTGGVAFLGTLVYHHIIPVSCGGRDSLENGLTLCSTCHIQLHVAERSGGRIPMTKDQFEMYSDTEQVRIKKILKYAKIAVEAHKRAGSSVQKIQEDAKNGMRHMMPGEGLEDNIKAFNSEGGR